MKFASLYQGRQEIPESVREEHEPSLQELMAAGKLAETSRIGRVPGRAKTAGKKQEKATEVAGGHGAGRAGLDILLRAGIHVDVLSEEDVEKKPGEEATGPEKERLQRRNDRLREHLAQIDAKIKEAK